VHEALDVKIGSNPISSANDDLSELAPTRRWKPSCPRSARPASAAGWWSKPSRIRRLRRAIQYAQMGFRHLSELKRSLER